MSNLPTPPPLATAPDVRSPSLSIVTYYSTTTIQPSPSPSPAPDSKLRRGGRRRRPGRGDPFAGLVSMRGGCERRGEWRSRGGGGAAPGRRRAPVGELSLSNQGEGHALLDGKPLCPSRRHRLRGGGGAKKIGPLKLEYYIKVRGGNKKKSKSDII